MKRIPLTQGQFALVDDEDFDELNQFKWCASWSGREWYALRRNPALKPTKLLMHRVIMNAWGADVVDHRNHSTLDNRKENLRITTHQGNAFNNRGKFRSYEKTSRFVGVSWCSRTKRWVAQLHINGKGFAFGHHKTEESAAMARDAAAKKHFGEFANLNFK